MSSISEEVYSVVLAPEIGEIVERLASFKGLTAKQFITGLIVSADIKNTKEIEHEKELEDRARTLRLIGDINRMYPDRQPERLARIVLNQESRFW